MEYSFIYGNKGYELPTYSMKIAEKIETVEKTNQGPSKFRDKCKSMYEFISNIIGKDNTDEIIGVFNESDPNIINLVYLEIVKQYNKPLVDYNAEETAAKLDDVGIDKITELLKALPNAEKLNLK